MEPDNNTTIRTGSGRLMGDGEAHDSLALIGTE